jgi:hypothetical protein
MTRARGRPPTWTDEQKVSLRALWKRGLSAIAIGLALGKSPDAVTSMRRALGLPEREKILFRISTHCVFYIFPRSDGVRKLLRRVATLQEWVAEGRDNYELARAFHVPIRDVETVIARLGLTRPAEQIAPEDALRVARRCLNCNEPFVATRYRFRCDQCVAQASRLDDAEYEVAA